MLETRFGTEATGKRWIIDSSIRHTRCACARPQTARTCAYPDSRTRTMERERTRGGGYACVHKPNVAAMVPLCILISTVFPHSACTGVH